jgi:16S rRNA (uracil1498-N3)-methyltransferase
VVGRRRASHVTRILLARDAAAAVGAVIELDDSESHHLQVRRAVPGELVEVRDGAGLTGSARLARSGRRWSVTLETSARAPRPEDLVLAVGAGDRERFGWLVEKATELGVTAVVPLETSRSSGVANRIRETHLERLQRQALEAVKQCGAAWAPIIEQPVDIAGFAARQWSGVKWLADAAGSAPPPVLDSGSVAVVIGPEGGLDSAERARLLTAGFEPMLLGPHTLRFETAAVAAAVTVALARLRGSPGIRGTHG